MMTWNFKERRERPILKCCHGRREQNLNHSTHNQEIDPIKSNGMTERKRDKAEGDRRCEENHHFLIERLHSQDR